MLDSETAARVSVLLSQLFHSTTREGPMDAPVSDQLLADCGAMLEQDFKEAHQYLNIVLAAVLLGRLVLDFDVIGPTNAIVKHRKAWRISLQLPPLMRA